tara:strand:- start:4049 stop:4408 length:360 start_codon:yes stop_codon:yes gene_type:complete
MASGNHYINNKELETLIIKYQGDPDTYGNELFEMYDLLISNIMDSFGFAVDRDDAKQECFLLLLKTVKNFDCDKGSAFNFFTTIIVNNLKLIYTKNKKYSEKMNEYITAHLKGYRPSSE